MRNIPRGNNCTVCFLNQEHFFQISFWETVGNAAIPGHGCSDAALLTLTLALFSCNGLRYFCSSNWSILNCRIGFCSPLNPLLVTQLPRDLRESQLRDRKATVDFCLLLCTGSRISRQHRSAGWMGATSSAPKGSLSSSWRRGATPAAPVLLWEPCGCDQERLAPHGRLQRFVEARCAWAFQRWECKVKREQFWLQSEGSHVVLLHLVCVCANGAKKEAFWPVCFCLFQSTSAGHTPFLQQVLCPKAMVTCSQATLAESRQVVAGSWESWA